MGPRSRDPQRRELLAEVFEEKTGTPVPLCVTAGETSLSRVRSAYRELAIERNWSIVSVVDAQGIRSMEDLTAEIEQLVDLALHSPAAAPAAKRT